MGIYCEINLYKPENGAFIGTTGTVVSGLIKYAVDEETMFSKITISLKGIGKLRMEKKLNNTDRKKYHNNETYIDMDNIISNDKDVPVPVGKYEIPFNFKIPCNVPPTLTYRKRGGRYNVKCIITYYIRIKFNRPGLMNFAKRFKKEITVISGIVPRLATTPIIYGGQKKLSQLFTRNPRVVNIKVNMPNSVFKTMDKIALIYEIKNDTNLAITAVETKLVEVYKFYFHEREITRNEYDGVETDSKTGAIQKGGIREMIVEINIPSGRESADFSKLVSRNYYVKITVYLPVPHRNYVMDIPIQIGNSSTESLLEAACRDFEEENPPSYWEAMNEYISDKSNFDEEHSTC